MAGTSSIEWTDRTWNPIVGCSIVSPGCTNCYAMKMAARLEAMGVPHYQGLTRKVNDKPVWTGVMRAAPDHILTEPLRWRKPQRIFVNSMSDLFGENVTDEQIDRVFAVMALTPRHTYQVLTKRAARMRAYIRHAKIRAPSVNEALCSLAAKATGEYDTPRYYRVLRDASAHWPLPNVWLGVSAEDDVRLHERLNDLLATPAARTFLSLEPMISPIRIPAWALTDPVSSIDYFQRVGRNGEGGRGRIDWVIVGGESGPGARPMHPDWARQIRDDCTRVGVPFFFKQWGEWREVDDGLEPGELRLVEVGSGEAEKLLSLATHPAWIDQNGAVYHRVEHIPDGGARLIDKFGKKAAGRLLDGATHDAMPRVRS